MQRWSPSRDDFLGERPVGRPTLIPMSRVDCRCREKSGPPEVACVLRWIPAVSVLIRPSLLMALLAADACSGSSGPQKGTGGASGSSGSQGGTGGASVTNCSVAGTGGGPRVCTGTVDGCSVNAAYEPPTGACDVEGAACRGHLCVNSYKIDEFDSDWATLCCGGQWIPIWQDALTSLSNPPTCPRPLVPGDPFRCGDGGLTCVTGQSACVERVDPITLKSQFSCASLCAAGDCSCFCPSSDGCTFNCQQSGSCPLDPSDQACPEDRCTCGLGDDTVGVKPQPGTVHLVCTTAARLQTGCKRDNDCLCASSAPRSFAYYCAGSGPPAADCVMAPLTGAGAICGVDTEYFCCPR